MKTVCLKIKGEGKRSEKRVFQGEKERVKRTAFGIMRQGARDR